VSAACRKHSSGRSSIGENITTAGIDWDQVLVGARLRLGAEVLLEITVFAPPCKTIRGAFQNGDFSRISHKLHPGWSRAYARVLNPGMVRPGDSIQLLPLEQ
jgi:MOSC domain-containing protein YiiM